MKPVTAFAAGLAAALAFSFVPPQDRTADASAPSSDVISAQKPSYPLDTCPISGEKLGGMGKPFDYVVDGRLVRLCCKSCTKDVDKDPQGVIAKIDAAVIQAQKPTYPLDTCPISGEKLDATAVDFVVGTRLVRTCCAKCKKTVLKNPRSALDKIDAALIEAQRPGYALKTCVVSGEPLGDDAVDQLYGTRLVRFCCSKCIKQFDKDPETYLAKLPAPAMARAKESAKK
jgi:hypothetical protein